MTAREAFPLLGLGWKTELAKTAYWWRGKWVDMPELKAHVRVDTGGRLGGVVGESYRRVENETLAEFADVLVAENEGGALDTAGCLLEGRQVFALVHLPATFEVAPDDPVDSYVCISNTHGARGSFNAHLTVIRALNRATLRITRRDLVTGIRLEHKGNMETKLAQAREVLSLARNEASAFEAQARALAARALSSAQARSFFRATYTDAFRKPPRPGDPKWAEHLKRWRAMLAAERVPGTAWAAVNVVAEWSDYEHLGPLLEQWQRETLTYRRLFGSGATVKGKAYERALELVR